jgi:peptide/nickel transport system substrate-binding protein
MSATAAARVGGWLDEIVFFEEIDQPKVLSMIDSGEVQFFANAFMGTMLPTIEGYGLPYQYSYGSYNTVLLNPEGPQFTDGRCNPFHDPEVKVILNLLFDRQYLIDEFGAGLGIPMYCSLLPVSPTYAECAVEARATEIAYAYNKTLGLQRLSDRLIELGYTKIDGKWACNGQKITLIGIIRVEDERLQIGLTFADWMEEAGFIVDRQQKTSSQASPIWNRSDPKLGQWHYYTGGWISNSIDRESNSDFCTHYTDVCYPTSRTIEYPDEVDPVLYYNATRSAHGQFTTPAERLTMFNYMIGAERANPINLWCYVESAPWVVPANMKVAVDLAAGIFGSRMWPRTMMYVDADGAPVVGGSVQIANQSFLTNPWNGPSGSNWLFDAVIQRALEDTPMLSDPFTGLAVKNFIERVDITATEGLPIFASEKNWVGLTFVPVINVPEDAWYDWDGAAQDFILAGPGKTSQVKIRYTYPEALWSYKWHDGSTISMGDLLMDFIFGTGMDTAKPESPYYDESSVSTYEANWQIFKGIKVISVHPLVYDLYVDGIALDAEVIAYNHQSWMWFTYGFGTQAWHNMAVGLMSEERGLAAFSEPKASALGVDWLNYAAGPTLQQMATNLIEAQITNFLPYANALGDYVTTQEIVDRYANLSTFMSQYGHLYIGTGPYFVKTFDPLASIVVINRFANYAFDLQQFLVFGEPKLANLTITGPTTVAIGTQVVYNVAITFQGEAYPANEIKNVGYIVLDAAGQIAFSGNGVITGDGAATVTLSAADTAKLGAGSCRLELIGTVKPAALMSTTYTTFIAQ